jgi:hypothetical protein
LEQSNLPQFEEEGAKKIIFCDLVAENSSNLHKEIRQKTLAQVQKSLEQLEDIFSLIFRAILVVSSFQVPNSLLEQDKLYRQSREFETRLKRNASEAKQQVRTNTEKYLHRRRGWHCICSRPTAVGKVVLRQLQIFGQFYSWLTNAQAVLFPSPLY